MMEIRSSRAHLRESARVMPEPLLWRAHTDAVNSALVARWLPPRGVAALKTDLFDESVSEGLYATLASHAGTVTGVDLSEPTTHAAARRHPELRAVCADVRSLPFDDAEFDFIASNSTLDHLESVAEIATAIAELSRVMARGARLVITLDNPLNPAVAVRNRLPFRWTSRAGLTPYRVGATCGARQLAWLLADAGLDVLESTAIMHCPRVVAVAVARAVESVGRPDARAGYLRLMLHFERLQALPSRFVTGHFVAATARKP